MSDQFEYNLKKCPFKLWNTISQKNDIFPKKNYLKITDDLIEIKCRTLSWIKFDK